MKPFQPIRTYDGVPPEGAFGNFNGTPIVINENNGDVYAFLGSVTLLGSGSFRPLTSSTITWDTAVSLSGMTQDFSAPSWATQIYVPIDALSTNGTSIPILQLGTASGIETSGYSGSTDQGGTGALISVGFNITRAWAATSVAQGGWTVTKLTGNTWTCTGVFGFSNAAATSTVAGSKTLTGTLTTVRLTTVSGADNFDGGTANRGYQ